MAYLETIGASCQNCGNRGKKNCAQKCLDKEYSKWEPAPGVAVQEYEVWHGKKRGRGRKVIAREAV